MNKTENLEVRVSITVTQPPGNYTGINLTETLMLPARGFMEMCQILAKFQDLVERLKSE